MRSMAGQIPARAARHGASIKLVDQLHNGNDGYLSDKTVFEYVISGREYRVKMLDDGIEVSQSLGGGLAVIPCVSNVVVVTSRRDA